MFKFGVTVASLLIATQIVALDFQQIFLSLDKLKQSWLAAKESQTAKSNRLFTEGERDLKRLLKAGTHLKADDRCKFVKLNKNCFKSACHDPDPETTVMGFCIDAAQNDLKIEKFQALPSGSQFTGEVVLTTVVIEGGGKGTYALTSPDESVELFQKALYTVSIFVKLKNITVP